MGAQGDERVESAVKEALEKGPRDVIALLAAVRRRYGALLERHEGAFHAVLHRLVRSGELTAASASAEGVCTYTLTGSPSVTSRRKSAPAQRAPSAPAPPDVGSADRLASAVRQPDDRARIAGDVLLHLAALRREDRRGAFGSARTARHYLRRVDRGRPTVCYARTTGDHIGRFLLHEGPWLLGAVIVFLVVRQFVAEVFVIPSSSMEPTLLPRDRVVVFKPRAREKLARWRIFTFNRSGTTYVKRVGGLGGEDLALSGGDVYVDGELAVKPDDVKRALRLPYATWDLARDARAWPSSTASDQSRVWRYIGPPLWSGGTREGKRVADADVLLRDVYAELHVVRAPGETVTLELAYVDPASGDAEVAAFYLDMSDAGPLLRRSTRDGEPEFFLWLGGRMPFETSSPLVLRLSHVDGLVESAVGATPWTSKPGNLPIGAVVVPRIRSSGPGSRPLRLVLAKDVHYSEAGELAVPPPDSDDAPLSHAFRVPDEAVFMLGDNTYDSRDSRYTTMGPVRQRELVGPVSFRIWPPGRLGGVR